MATAYVRVVSPEPFARPSWRGSNVLRALPIARLSISLSYFHPLHVTQLTLFRFMSIKMLRSTILLRPLAPLALLLPFLATACGDDADLVGIDNGDAGSSASGSSGNGSGTSGAGGNGSGTSGASGNGSGTSGAGGSAVTPDTTPPTVVSNFPLDDATGEATSVAISVTFSEAMDPLTLTDASFSLEQGTDSVPGVVTYFNREATFLPLSDLDLDTTYTATITTVAEDAAGNALEAEHTWSFETDATAAIGPAPVLLGAAGTFTILAKSTVTNEPTSVITGDLGLSPAAASYITGFGLTRAGTRWTTPQVTGSVFAANNDPPTPSNLTTAVGAMEAAYTDAAGRSLPDFLDIGAAGAIGGLTLTPGLYRWNSAVTIPTEVTISGAANDRWIFQITGDLTMAAAQEVTLIGGARAKNIVWQVAGTVDLGTTAHFEGVILSQTAITLGAGSSINGRLLAQTAVNLASTTVTAPAR